MNILIGNTGLIGQTLKKSLKFDLEFNSKNIHEYTDTVQDGGDLYLCCLPATKWLVNKNVKKDLDNIVSIVDIIKTRKYNNIYLISTIDVYLESPSRSNESSVPIIKNFNYGSNRYLFELMVQQFVKFNHIKIYRLPALFSEDIKKNVLYDLLNNNNVQNINANSIYQWYDLKDLVEDIKKSHSYDSKIINLFPEGVDTSNIIKELFPEYDPIVKREMIVFYDYKTKLRPGGYWYYSDKSFELIKKFVNEYRSKQSSVG